MNETIRPARGWVVLCPIPKSEYVKESGIVIPEHQKEWKTEEWGVPRARVVAVSDQQKYTAMGKEIEYNCRVGDIVLHRTGGGYLFGKPIPGEAFLLLQDDQIIAVVERKVDES